MHKIQNAVVVVVVVVVVIDVALSVHVPTTPDTCRLAY